MQKLIGLLINISVIFIIIFYFKLDVYAFLLFIIWLLIFYTLIFVLVKNINKTFLLSLISISFFLFFIVVYENNIYQKYNYTIKQNVYISSDYDYSSLKSLNNSQLLYNKTNIFNNDLNARKDINEDIHKDIYRDSQKDAQTSYLKFKENINNNKYNKQEEMLKDFENLIRVGVENLNNQDKDTYLLLGNIYEIGFMLGISEAEKFAFKSYNKYCELDLNNPNCYNVLANFTALDKTKNKQALEYIHNALLLATSTEQKKDFEESLNFIKNKK